jgi:hypothetical protein
MHKSALVVPHIINSREYYSFKVGTIQWINDRLDTLSVGTGDATIGSILLLINFEVCEQFSRFLELDAFHVRAWLELVELRN